MKAKVFDYYMMRLYKAAPVWLQRLFLWYVYRPYRQDLPKDGTAPIFHELYIELRTRCNSTVCRFCPAVKGADERPDITMPFEVYAKVIDQLAEINYGGRIAFYLSNEPLIVKDFPRYVAYAREKLPQAWLMITTNGQALTPKTGRPLLEAGLNMINLNLYNDDLEAPLPEPIKRFEEEVLQAYAQQGRVQYQGSRHSAQGQPVDFVYNVNRRLATEVLTNRGGSAPNNLGDHERQRSPLGLCDNPFYSMTITSDGRVGRCCSDHYIHEALGNIKDQPLMEIWNGAAFGALRRALLRNDRPAGVCRVCDSAGIRWSRQNSWQERFLKNLTQ
ncbi:Radical SAM domain protein [Magnetococcus marinus MC-1]|uniref:Radical SAM domain protein n=1 Tax=Magnetococcus marinus (strain ATCC BAA-1437 / JCM 17883 / MC-1) TaxID=156889 RepID=A0LD49_MAGMM|nr:radical SAM/SPASM domain-containing protein [Magnetococcus marinus]ABK45892.1 Radical SAM domain protein [Magnetococcus marinus MC-1]